jgi:hypothetical protein
MPTISLTREIRLTNEDALNIVDSKPSRNLQAILKSIETKGTTQFKENKLILRTLRQLES